MQKIIRLMNKIIVRFRSKTAFDEQLTSRLYVRIPTSALFYFFHAGGGLCEDYRPLNRFLEYFSSIFNIFSSVFLHWLFISGLEKICSRRPISNFNTLLSIHWILTDNVWNPGKLKIRSEYEKLKLNNLHRDRWTVLNLLQAYYSKSTSDISELVETRKTDKLIFIFVSIGNDVVSWDV